MRCCLMHLPVRRGSAHRWAATRSWLIIVSLFLGLAGSLVAQPGTDRPPGDAAIRLLPPENPLAVGRTRMEAQPFRDGVARVEFLLDGNSAGSDQKAPFGTWMRLPSLPEPVTVEAIAYSEDGARLGSDRLTLNHHTDRFGVSFREPEAIPGPGTYDVDLDVLVPTLQRIHAVELFWNDEALARFKDAPYQHQLTVTDASQSGYLRAQVSLADGRSQEAVMMMGDAAWRDQLTVDMVQLQVVIRDGEKGLVESLVQDDFAIHEDGIAQTIDRVEHAKHVPLTLALAVDTSVSMRPYLPLVSLAAERFLDGVLQPGDRVMLASFDDHPRVLQPLTNDYLRLLSQIDNIELGEETSLYDAVAFASLSLAGHDGQRAIVLLTDGEDTVSRLGFSQSLEVARRVGVPVYVVAIGLGSPQHRQELKTIAKRTGATLLPIRNAHGLTDAYETIAEELRSQYLVTYYSSQPPDQTGWRDVALRVTEPKLEIRTVKGYYVNP